MTYEKIAIAKPSARGLAKLKKGHKIRIHRGADMEIVVYPHRHRHIAHSFLRGKGAEIALSPEELKENHGRGIFDFVQKGIRTGLKAAGGKKLEDAVYKAGSIVKPIAEQFIDPAVDYGLGALATARPELAPVIAMGDPYLKKGIRAGLGYGDATAEPPSREPVAASKGRKPSMVNNYLAGDTNTGFLQNSTIGNLLSKMSLDDLQGILDWKRKMQMPQFDTTGGHQVLSPYADPVGGHGLYAAPRSRGLGLHHKSHHGLPVQGIRQFRHRKEIGSIGINGNLLGHGLPPALMSQPYSANYQFGSHLPPAYQKFAKSGSGLYA